MIGLIFCIIELVIFVTILLGFGLTNAFLNRITMLNSFVFAVAVGVLLYQSNRKFDAFFDFKINPIICVVIGIVIFNLVFFIHHTKVGFWIFTILFSIVWGYIAGWLIFTIEYNFIWFIVAFIIAFAGCIKLHLRARKLIELGV